MTTTSSGHFPIHHHHHHHQHHHHHHHNSQHRDTCGIRNSYKKRLSTVSDLQVGVLIKVVGGKKAKCNVSQFTTAVTTTHHHHHIRGIQQSQSERITSTLLHLSLHYPYHYCVKNHIALSNFHLSWALVHLFLLPVLSPLNKSVILWQIVVMIM